MRDKTHYSTNTLSAVPEVDWRQQAACALEDPETFFPTGGTKEEAEPARSVCRRCPVADECLRWALDTGQEFGIWGGLTVQERRQHRREQGILVRRADRPPGISGVGERADQIRRMVRAGCTIEAIAQRYGVAVRTVQRWCDTAGIPAARGEPQPWTGDELAQLVQLARDGASDREIGHVLGRSRSSVENARHKAGIAAGATHRTEVATA